MISIKFNHSYTKYAREMLLDGLEKIKFNCETSEECWSHDKCTGCVYAELCRDLGLTIKYLEEHI